MFKVRRYEPVYLCGGPFIFMEPLTCVRPFRFCVTLLHLHRAFSITELPGVTREAVWYIISVVSVC